MVDLVGLHNEPSPWGSEAAREYKKTIKYRFSSSVTEPQRDRGTAIAVDEVLCLL